PRRPTTAICTLSLHDALPISRRRCRTTLVICGGALTGAVAFGQKQFLESQARVVSAHYRVLLLCQLCQCRNDSPLHQPARQRNGSPSRHLPDSEQRPFCLLAQCLEANASNLDISTILCDSGGN